VTLDLDTGKRIRDAAAGKVITSVGYHWRYSRATEHARALIDGKPLALAAGYWTGGVYGPQWWRTRSQSGGQLVEQTTHIVDLARHLVGEVVRVRAAARRGLMTDVPGYDIDDASVAQLEFENGVIGTIISVCTLDFNYHIQLDLIGRDSVIEVECNRVTQMTRGVRSTWEYRESLYAAEMEAFLTAVRTKDTSGIRSTYGDALKTVAVSLAANKSMVSGKPAEPEV
jgi:predicted dehydrogenase